MTRLLFREDAYRQSCDAKVTAVSDRGIGLDQTVFYATAGGQAGDIGTLKISDGRILPIATTVKDRETGQVLHIIADGHDLPTIGDTVTVDLDWDTRHRLNPELVRTMSVQPPMDGHSIRTVTIEGIDYQPCGGTHVKRTGEIGKVLVSKIEKKGRQNRRINIVFDE